MYSATPSPFARMGPYSSDSVAFTVVSPVTGTLAEEVPEAAGVVAAGDGVTASWVTVATIADATGWIWVAAGWSWVGTPVTAAGPQAVISRAIKIIAPGN